MTDGLDEARLEALVRRVVAEAVPAIVRELRSASPAAEPLMTRKELAERLRCSVKTLDGKNTTGAVPRPVRTNGGRHVRWRRETILAWEAAGMPSRRKWEALQSAEK